MGTLHDKAKELIESTLEVYEEDFDLEDYIECIKRLFGILELIEGDEATMKTHGHLALLRDPWELPEELRLKRENEELKRKNKKLEESLKCSAKMCSDLTEANEKLRADISRNDADLFFYKNEFLSRSANKGETPPLGMDSLKEYKRMVNVFENMFINKETNNE